MGLRWSERIRLEDGWGFRPDEVDAYRFGGSRRIDECTRFLTREHKSRLLHDPVNLDHCAHMLGDKWVAAALLERAGCETPRTYGLYLPIRGTSSEGQPFGDLNSVRARLGDELPAGLVFKPRFGQQGRNVRIAEVRSSNGDPHLRVGGIATTLSAILSELPDDGEGFLLQERIVQHEELDVLCPDTTNTVRVVTFLTCTNDVRILAATLRIGRHGATLDTWDQGGVSVGVEPSTGVLGQGCFKPTHGGAWVSHHPDTDVLLAGRRLPHWADVQDLATRAARAIPGLRIVGWDLAIGRRGPVVIEGNVGWHLPAVQMHTSGMLTPQLRADLASLGVHLPGELPGLARSIGCRGSRRTREITRRGRKRVQRLLGVRPWT